VAGMSMTGLKLATESLSVPTQGRFHDHGPKWAVSGQNDP
jgi:hypothetical protein